MPKKNAPSRRRSLRSEEMAMIVRGSFDIPAKIRHLLIVAGICGIVIVIVASLVGNKPGTIAVDKLLHFSGFLVLAFVLVLGLRPRLFLPALIGLVVMGYLIELLQPLNGRSKDMHDLIADSLGIGAGLVAGLVARGIHSLVRKELATLSVRRRVKTYPTGATILREGSPSDKIYFIQSGQVRLSRQVDGQNQELSTLGPGEVIGLLGVIQGKPQFSTVEAIQPTRLYGMEFRELMESIGDESHPLALVLATFAEKTCELVERLNRLEQPVGHSD